MEVKMLNHDEQVEFFRLKEILPDWEKHITNTARVQTEHEFGVLREIFKRETERACAVLGDKYDETYNRYLKLKFKQEYPNAK